MIYRLREKPSPEYWEEHYDRRSTAVPNHWWTARQRERVDGQIAYRSEVKLLPRHLGSLPLTVCDDPLLWGLLSRQQGYGNSYLDHWRHGIYAPLEDSVSNLTAEVRSALSSFDHATREIPSIGAVIEELHAGMTSAVVELTEALNKMTANPKRGNAAPADDSDAAARFALLDLD